MTEQAPGLFDTVLVTFDGSTRRLAPEEFAKIPLTQRVRYLLSDAVEFRQRGEVVHTQTALKSIAHLERQDANR